ncbi:fungal-specific transcription factor domain-containing protein [Xylaria cf. heliscus]|nr:fungal-specific transcription factor domain-containing protein [Xylaria cf. heliscus]
MPMARWSFVTSPGDHRQASDETVSVTSPTRAVHRRGLKRTSAACQRCRRRKQKCDGRLPVCAPCQEAKTSCVPSERLIYRIESNCQCDALRSQIISLEEEISSLRRLVSQLSEGNDASPRQPIPDECGQIPDNEAIPDALVGSYRGRIVWPTFPSRSSNTTADSEFLSPPWHLWNGIAAVETPESINDIDELPFGEYAPQLIDIFFARRWPQLPVLHRKSFLDLHYAPYLNHEGQEQAQAQAQAISGLSSFQVNMVLAIGAIEKSATSIDRHASHQKFFQKAIQNINSVLNANDLDCIQSLLLLYMYGCSEPQSVNLWYVAGLALRLAIGINLHRRERTLNQDVLDAEMSKRIFWSVYAMDRSLSISMGKPLGIHDGDITMPFPLRIADDLLVHNFDQPIISTGMPQVNDTSTFLHILDLRRITADVYRVTHSVSESHSHDEAVDALRIQLRERLDQWILTSPRYLAPTSMNQTPEWFQIAYHQALIHLYRPSAVSPATNLDALRICADSSISLMSYYAALYSKNRITYTFVAVNSAFLAAITMLYSLRASSTLRQELTREVAEHNIKISVKVIRDIANGRKVGDRCAQILERLGDVVLPTFSTEVDINMEVDTEFLSWFGLQTQQAPGSPQQIPTIPSMDMPWHELLEHGFSLDGVICPDLFL